MLNDRSLAEEEQSIVSTMSRQFLRTHRPFRAVVMDRTGKPILWVSRLGGPSLKSQLMTPRFGDHSNSSTRGYTSARRKGRRERWSARLSSASSAFSALALLTGEGQGMASLAKTIQHIPIVRSVHLRFYGALISQRREEEKFSQFARVDSGFFAWDFWLQDRDNREALPCHRSTSTESGNRARGLDQPQFPGSGARALHRYR